MTKSEESDEGKTKSSVEETRQAFASGALPSSTGKGTVVDHSGGAISSNQERNLEAEDIPSSRKQGLVSRIWKGKGHVTVAEDGGSVT